MALSSRLKNLVNEPSGTYIIEIDASRQVPISNNIFRLIIGFSRKGPFNTPIFIPDANFFRNVFGDIDRTLERKGCFFHRSALTMLTRGPVICLNLLRLQDEDTTEFYSLSTSPDADNIGANSAPVADNFNQQKFWFLEARSILNNISANINQPDPHLLNIVNVGRKPITVFTRRAEASEFDIRASEWFGKSKVPQFMHKDDYISDYMIDVIVVEGDFSDFEDLKNDPSFGHLFNSKGLKKTYTDGFGNERDGLESFLSIGEVTVLQVYTGALIPDFFDKNGNPLYIEEQVNADTDNTGLAMAIREDLFDEEFLSGDIIDLVGHTIRSEDVTTFNFLSYYGDIAGKRDYSVTSLADLSSVAETFGATGATGGTGANTDAYLTASSTLQGAAGYTSGTHYDVMTLYSPDDDKVQNGTVNSPFNTHEEFNTFKGRVSADRTYIQSTDNGGQGYNLALVKDALKFDTSIELQIYLSDAQGDLDGDSEFLYITEGDTTVYPKVDFTEDLDSQDDSVNSELLYAGPDSPLYSDWTDGIINQLDTGIVDDGAGGTTGAPIDFFQWDQHDFTADPRVNATHKASHPITYLEVVPYESEDFNVRYEPGFVNGATEHTITTVGGSVVESFPVSSKPSKNVVHIDNSSGNFDNRIEIGQFLLNTLSYSETSKSRLTRITDVQVSGNELIVTTRNDILVENGQVRRYEGIESYIETYRPLSMSGYSIRDVHLPNSTEKRMNEIYDVMYNSGIKQGLTDKEAIDFRYIVDVFPHGIEPESKARLSNIAKDRQFAFAILNTPFFEEFRDSTEPLFKFDSQGRVQTRYIADGGNRRLNPSFLYSLPSIDQGANYCAFYAPGLLIRQGRKNIKMPPAAHVSNLYIDKHNNGLPYEIVAGPDNGVLSGINLAGLEYEFDDEELKPVENFGWNVILRKSGRGLVINANNTAQQDVQSALSAAHVRELLIHIERNVDDILSSFRWRFNTPDNRLRIKTQVDDFLAGIVSDGGLNDFRTVMDSSNNTSEVIDARIGVIDIGVEPIRGLGKLVQRNRIFSTGAIERGEFQLASG